MIRNTLISTALAAMVLGCAGVDRVQTTDDMYNHYVRMDRDDSPVNISTGKQISASTFSKNQANKIAEKIVDTKKPVVAIFVHGAPLYFDVQVNENRRRLTIMKNNPEWHPILFNWEGTMADVYYDHLYRISNGQEVSETYGIASAPFSFLGDFFVALGRAVPTWFSMSKHIYVTEYPQFDSTGYKESAKTTQILAGSTSNNVTSNDKNAEEEGLCESPDEVLNISAVPAKDPEFSASTLATFPTDTIRYAPMYIFSPFIASYGSSMWTNYRRRAGAAVRQSNEFGNDNKRTEVTEFSPTGALAKLVNEIDNYTSEKAHKVEFILIGHSTGTIILSELIETYVGADKNDKPNITKIAFLGAAATLQDFHRTVSPYLLENDETKFYNISLNAYDEARLSYGPVLTPSLLEWLDMFIAQPADHMHRVMGKWENMMLAVHTIPCAIRSRVHLKHLPAEKGFPRTHRGLDEVHDFFNPFRESDWEVVKAERS